MLALGSLCLILWMALLSYDKSDRSWSHDSNVAQVQNAAGPVGAWCADILFVALGYFAYLFPLLLAAKTWQVFRQRHQAFDWSGWAVLLAHDRPGVSGALRLGPGLYPLQ